jgi:S1-C subfamily serine protease
LGVALAPEADGLRVVSVYDPSPAREAGISVGDLLLSVNGQPAAEAPSPFAAPGSTVTLQLRRGGAQLERSVPVVDLLPDAPAQ